jgi:hypothetical protein
MYSATIYGEWGSHIAQMSDFYYCHPQEIMCVRSHRPFLGLEPRSYSGSILACRMCSAVRELLRPTDRGNGVERVPCVCVGGRAGGESYKNLREVRRARRRRKARRKAREGRG